MQCATRRTFTRNVVRLNLEGISHEQSLIQPQPAGNCSNWVVGHLVTIYNKVLPLLEQTPVESAAISVTTRGVAGAHARV